jgi:hypothetical protein
VAEATTANTEAMIYKYLWMVDLLGKIIAPGRDFGRFEIHKGCSRGEFWDRMHFILGMAKVFRIFGLVKSKAKVGLQVSEKREFSGFACSYEQAKNRRKPGETRLLA